MTAIAFPKVGLPLETVMAFAGSIAISKGDLCYDSSGSVLPASSQADQGTLVKNQRLFARNFAGLSNDARNATDGAVTDFPVALLAYATVDCTSTTFNKGDWVGIAENSGGTACENQKVAKVTDPSLVIGLVCKKYASATTRVEVLFISRKLPLSVLRIDAPAVIVETSDRTVLAAETGYTFTTEGASGTVVFSLPAATVGLEYTFFVGAAQALRIDPNGTETIALPSTGAQGGAGLYIWADAAGETVSIKCVKAGEWVAKSYIGTWTSE